MNTCPECGSGTHTGQSLRGGLADYYAARSGGNAHSGLVYQEAPAGKPTAAPTQHLKCVRPIGAQKRRPLPE
jgi:hypothetical protein